MPLWDPELCQRQWMCSRPCSRKCKAHILSQGLSLVLTWLSSHFLSFPAFYQSQHNLACVDCFTSQTDACFCKPLVSGEVFSTIKPRRSCLTTEYCVSENKQKASLKYSIDHNLSVPWQGSADSLGISIAGGVGSPLGDVPIFIAMMHPNGVAAQTQKLRVSFSANHKGPCKSSQCSHLLHPTSYGWGLNLLVNSEALAEFSGVKEKNEREHNVIRCKMVRRLQPWSTLKRKACVQSQGQRTLPLCVLLVQVPTWPLLKDAVYFILLKSLLKFNANTILNTIEHRNLLQSCGMALVWGSAGSPAEPAGPTSAAWTLEENL